MNSSEKARKGGAILFLVALCIFSTGQLLLNEYESGTGPWGSDARSEYLRRFEGVQERLPPVVALGYMSDDFFYPKLAPRPYIWAGYRLACYGLAPRVIERGIDYEYVLGNFHHVQIDERFRHEGLVVAEKFGNGVVLFRRVSE
jgi:hypothetical protein